MGDRRAAILHFNTASQINDQLKKGQGGDMQAVYQLRSSAALNDPEMGMAWFQLAEDLADMQLSAASLAACRRAIECQDGEVPGDMTRDFRIKSMIQLAYRLHIFGRTGEARQVINKALHMDDRVGQAWNVSSLIHSLEGMSANAILASRKALEIEPDNATFETALGLNLLFAGAFKEGLKHFEARYRYKLKHFLNMPYPQWQGEMNKTVYLVADQGLGDTLSFARFLRQAAHRSKFMYVGAQKELIRLFKASFQDIPNIEIFTPNAVGYPPAECWTTFVSLPTALDLTREEFVNAPNILIPQFSVSKQWKATDRKLHIGVAWKGSPISDIGHHKSFPVECLLRLYEVPGVQLYSLQADAAVPELHNAGCAALIRDLSPFIQDVADTTAILRELDLVVTVESALGHIAGACGVEHWVPYSALGHDWRIGRNGENIIWYPKLRVFKQGPRDAWSDVFGEIVEALRERVSS